MSGPASHSLKSLLLGPPGLTLAVAESLTGGRLQARVTAESGSSAYFLGGVTAYTIESKVRLLAVDRSEAEASACVSARVAEQMAEGVCRLLGSDLGLATTGWAEPSAEAGVAEPFAWWAVAHWDRVASRARRTWSGRVAFPGQGRHAVQQAVTDAVWAELERYLRELRRA
jgi:nicotinamide-nucleotide amidase